MGELDTKVHPDLADLEGLRVSSHFFIERNGRIVQFVGCGKRAWHAGVSRFNGRDNCNDFSIGIELEGTDFVAFEDEQYQALEKLLMAIDARYGLSYIVILLRGEKQIRGRILIGCVCTAPGRRSVARSLQAPPRVCS